MKKLSKKQINTIALMWAASQIKNCGEDSFDLGFKYHSEVVKAAHRIGSKLLGDLPQLHTLPGIIEYVAKQIK